MKRNTSTHASTGRRRGKRAVIAISVVVATLGALVATSAVANVAITNSETADPHPYGETVNLSAGNINVYRNGGSGATIVMLSGLLWSLTTFCPDFTSIDARLGTKRDPSGSCELSVYHGTATLQPDHARSHTLLFELAETNCEGVVVVAGEKRERALRSDSLRNRDAILEAAAECLTANPNASLADIAHEAGIARITIYGHFASRSDLLTALLHTSMTRVEAELALLDVNGDSWKAMEALLATSWRLVNSLSVLRGVVEQSLPGAEIHGSHVDPRARVEHLLERGRADGSFRSDQSVEWQSSCYFALLHGAASEIRAGHLTEADAQAFLMPTIRSLFQASPAT